MAMATSKRIRQTLAATIIFAGLAIAGTVAVKQFRSSAPTPPPSSSSPEIDMAMTRVSFSEMRGDEKLWDLTADKAEYDKDKGLVRLEKVRTEIFEGKAGGASIISRQGEYHEAAGMILMEGDVQITTRRGMVLHTDRLAYRAAAGEVATDRPVQVLDGRLRLTATGMVLDVQNEKVRFSRQVNAVIEGRNAKQ